MLSITEYNTVTLEIQGLKRISRVSIGIRNRRRYMIGGVKIKLYLSAE